MHAAAAALNLISKPIDADAVRGVYYTLSPIVHPMYLWGGGGGEGGGGCAPANLQEHYGSTSGTFGPQKLVTNHYLKVLERILSREYVAIQKLNCIIFKVTYAASIHFKDLKGEGDEGSARRGDAPPPTPMHPLLCVCVGGGGNEIYIAMISILVIAIILSKY